MMTVKLIESFQICADAAVSCSNWGGDDYVFQKVNWRFHLCPKVLEDKAIIKIMSLMGVTCPPTSVV
jgi:hypothetical protein